MQLFSLEKCINLDELETALQSLPDDLDKTYDRILDSVPPQRMKNAIRLLQFLVHSERPLTLNEAVDAITVKLDGNLRFAASRRMLDPQEVAVYCSGLVAVVSRQDSDNKGRTVMDIQLAHFLVKEYLVLDRQKRNVANDSKTNTFRAFIANNLEDAVARASIAEVCLVYLLELEHDLPAKDIRQTFFLA